MADDRPAGWELAISIACWGVSDMRRVRRGENDSERYAFEVGGTSVRMIGDEVVVSYVGSGRTCRAPYNSSSAHSVQQVLV